MTFPFLVFGFSLILLWGSTQAGIYLRRKRGDADGTAREDLGRIFNATLTLLGLIIGFSFSMAITQYHQRISAEEAEANAIGTEFERAGLLPAGEKTRVREWLSAYLNQRILFYETLDPQGVIPISALADRLENQIWSAVQAVAEANPTPITALEASGVNDIATSQRSTKAAWSTRIPVPAWAMLEIIAVFGTFLYGYIALSDRWMSGRYFVLPLIIAIALGFIADMDNPRDGIIQIPPYDLMTLSASMRE